MNKIKLLKSFLFIACVLLSHGIAMAGTPHIDAVESQLRLLAPGSEGIVWERTQGNKIAGYGINGDKWLLQSPDCWGDADCSEATGLQRLADTIYNDIAAAREWVDITTLVTYPDGIFQEAIVNGLKKALSINPDLTVRILAGTPPVMGSVTTPYSETAFNYMKRLKEDLGTYFDNARIIVAAVETSWLWSWNHSKIIAVDAKTAIVGGHNMWESAYGNVDNPISDVSMRLMGPAAESAHKFADELWDFACTNNNLVSDIFYVDIVKGEGFKLKNNCPVIHQVSVPQNQGNVDVLALGGLGFGMDVPGGTSGGLLPANDPYAACNDMLTDYVNNDSEFSVANPQDEGLRALIKSARESVFISQQDLVAPCVFPIANSYYDARLFNVLADKLIEGVKVRIVLSSPGAKQGYLAPYSNMNEMSDITDILIRKIQSRAGVNETESKNIICSNLQLAPLRIAYGVETWANGNSFGNHAKVISVDNEAFYIGSKNLYPTTLQDFGYIVEDTAAASDFKTQYIDKIWMNSRSAAFVDFEQGVCNF